MISGCMNSNVAQRTSFFGMLRCIGASKQQIVNYVRLEALNWCKSAIPIGCALGTAICWICCAILRFFVKGEWADMPLFAVSPAGILCGAVVGIITVLIAAHSPAKQAAKVSPAAAVTGNTDEAKKIVHAANTKLFKVETSLGINHATRRKKNLFLMTGSFALTIILFLTFSACLDVVNKLLPSAVSEFTPDITIASENDTNSIDRDLLNAIEQVEGVDWAFGFGLYAAYPVEVNGNDTIAVNDRYDSSSPDNAHDGIIIPLRNMINEAYAMDIARKIKAQQRQAMKDGKYVGGRTPYGYLKAPDDCHQLIVDPVAAEVVKTMFQWAAEGAGLNTIAVRLNEAGYLSPSHYKRTLGEITHENLVGNGHWQTRTVAKILRAEVYTGDLVQGVSKIIDHKQVRASADEWTTVRGTHEAIISRELFAAVQKALDQAAQQAKDREIHSWSPNLLKGKIFCAHCGRSLHRQKCVRRKSQEVYVYHCISNNRIKKGVCPGAFIFEKELLDTLADMIQEQLDTTLGQYSLGLENLSKEAEEQKNIQAKIASRKQEIQQLRTYQRGLYEGLIQNHLSKDEYFTFKEKYEAKIEAISKEIEQLKAGLAILAKQLEQYKMLSQDAQHIKEDRQLTAALIDRLIDRVEVSKEKRITVRFRFQSEFEHCEEVLSQCRNM